MFTTMERLQGKIGFDGAVIRYNTCVLTAEATWRKGEGFGYIANVYTSIGDEEEGFAFIEARLEHTTASQEMFTDPGHAIQWALTQLTK